MKPIRFTLIAAAIASLGGCGLYDNAKKAQLEGVGTAQSAAIDYEFRAGDQMTIKHANSAPQKFASTATATDKVFALVYSLNTKGFALKDVQEMVSISELYSNRPVLRRIVGKPVGTIQRQRSRSAISRLNPQQPGAGKAYSTGSEQGLGVPQGYRPDGQYDCLLRRPGSRRAHATGAR